MSRIALRVDQVFTFNTIILKQTPKSFTLQLVVISMAQTNGSHLKAWGDSFGGG